MIIATGTAVFATAPIDKDGGKKEAKD